MVFLPWPWHPNLRSGRVFGDAAGTLLDSLDHGEVSRGDLRARAREEGIPDARLLIPADGELLEL